MNLQSICVSCFVFIPTFFDFYKLRQVKCRNIFGHFHEITTQPKLQNVDVYQSMIFCKTTTTVCINLTLIESKSSNFQRLV